MSFVLTEIEEIDPILHARINLTRRIKYTCLSASTNYLALGSTSGSIYLFSREPCSFLQLIPLSEGCATRVQISPDEKIIALATARGTVNLVTLKPTMKVIGTSIEHIGEQVECLCWKEDSSEIYIGDGKGKVSVMVLSIFTVNGLFQGPSCTLMDLDSCIIQMSSKSSLLLVSTLTRCYLSYTSLEHYKQVGNQSRDGEFGACFLKLHTDSVKTNPLNDNVEKLVENTVRRAFDFIADNNDNIDSIKTVEERRLIKIFCARPGSRLWEVNTLGFVVKTHQFKKALAIAPQSIYRLHSSKDLQFQKMEDTTWPARSTNFSRLFVIQQKYLFSFSSDGAYVIDPINAQVVLWNDELTNISMADVVEDKIYFMTHCGTFHCLTLVSTDAFILKLYERKLSQECLRAIMFFKPELLELTDKNDESALIPIINNLVRSKTNDAREKKPGIVLVNSGVEASVSNAQSCFVSEIEENMTSSTSSVSSTDTASLPCNAKLTLTEDINDKMRDTLCEVQESLERAVFALSNDLSETVTQEGIEAAILRTKRTFDTAKEKYSGEDMRDSLFEIVRSTELHCGNVLLENLENLNVLQTAESNGIILVEAMRIFLDLNPSTLDECQCGFPLPNSQPLKQPKFLDVGIILVDRFEKSGDDSACIHLCSKVPFLWQKYITVCNKERLFLSPDFRVLKRCLQTKDKGVLSVLLTGLDRKQWRIVAECIKNIKNGWCLSCGRSIDSAKRYTMEIDWTSVATEIIKRSNSNGPEAALRFCAQLNDALPHISLDNSIFCKIIFSKILNRHGITDVIELDRTKENIEYHSICSSKVREDLINTLKKDTEKPINESAFGSGAHHWGMRYTTKSSICPCCTLSLQTPVLLGDNGVALFSCGHAYHVNCLVQKKIARCNLHCK